MTSSRFAALALGFAISLPATAFAQVILQRTPAPIVTAESERWYLNGDPITYSGNIYYPTGAQIHFNASEMVRSGFFNGIPLYVRTTLEPFSIVYVPLAGGMMQPYERRRTGELAGTAGAATPSLVTAGAPADASATTPQAPGPPPGVGVVVQEPAPVGSAVPAQPARPPAAVRGAAPVAQEPRPVGTSGRTAPPPSHTRIGPAPQGINAVFIEFRDRRWYPAGKSIPLDPLRMIQIGERRGFPVFVDRSEPESTIYIPSTIGSTMVVPYSTRRQP